MLYPMFNFAELVSLWSWSWFLSLYGSVTRFGEISVVGIFLKKWPKENGYFSKWAKVLHFYTLNNFFIRRFSKNITVWANFKVFCCNILSFIISMKTNLLLLNLPSLVKKLSWQNFGQKS